MYILFYWPVFIWHIFDSNVSKLLFFNFLIFNKLNYFIIIWFSLLYFIVLLGFMLAWNLFMFMELFPCSWNFFVSCLCSWNLLSYWCVRISLSRVLKPLFILHLYTLKPFRILLALCLIHKTTQPFNNM